MIQETKVWKDLQDTAEVNAWFETFAESHNIDRAICRKMCMVFDDLLSNIIKYAYQGENHGEVEVGLALQDGQLQVTLSDDGLPFDPLGRIEPDTGLSVKDREIGGLGIHLCRKMVDEISYQRQGDRNVLSMRILLPG